MKWWILCSTRYEVVYKVTLYAGVYEITRYEVVYEVTRYRDFAALMPAR